MGYYGSNYDYGESPAYKDEDITDFTRKSIHYGIEIFTDDGTPQHNLINTSDSSIGLMNGVIRLVSDRPGYDAITKLPTYGSSEVYIDGSTLSGSCPYRWYENLLTSDSILSNPVTEIDITEAGNVGTLSGMSFSITNFDKIYKDYEDLGIYFINRKVRFWIFVNDVMYCRWQGIISNDPYNDIDYTFECEPDLSKFRNIIPPLSINTTTYVNSADYNSQLKKNVISPSSGSNVKNTESIPVPICIGDIPYAKLFNTSGQLNPELISYSVPAGKFSYVTPAIASGNGNKVIPFKSEYGVTGVALKTNIAITGDYTPGSTWFDKNCLIINNGTGDFVANKNKNAYYLMLSYRMMYYESNITNINTLLTDPNVPKWVIDSVISKIQPFNGYYVYKQGTEKGIRINHSWLTWVKLSDVADVTSRGGAYVLILELDEKPSDFESLNTSDANDYTGNALRSSNAQTSYYHYNGNLSNVDSRSRTTDFFYISKSYLSYIVSTKNIDKFNNFLVNGETVTSGFPVLYSYDKDNNTYDKLYSESFETNISITGSYLSVNSPTSINADGESLSTTALPINIGSVDSITLEQLWWTIPVGSYLSSYTFKTTSLVNYYNKDGSGVTDDISNIVDRDRSTYNEITTTSGASGVHAWMVTFKIDANMIPFDQFADDEKLYFGVDLQAKTLGITSDRQTIHQMFSYRVYDQYGKFLPTDSLLDPEVNDRRLYITGGLQSHHAYPSRTDNYCDALSLTTSQQDLNEYINNLPDEYYYCGGDTNKEGNYFGQSKLLHFDNTKSACEIDIEKVRNYVSNGKSDGYIYIDLFICVSDSSGKHLSVAPVNNFNLNLKLKEIGFIVDKKIKYSEDLYTEISGERTSTYGLSNNPYSCLRLLTETYCGATGSSVNYNDLPAARGATSEWCNFGRQLTERKEAMEYIKTICQQSFIGMYQSRNGIYQFKTFDSVTSNIYHSDTIDSLSDVTMIRDSIRLDKTSVDKCYNDITINYNYNKGADTYDKQLIIGNIDDAVTVVGHTGGTGFPSVITIGQYGERLWREYCSFPGMPTVPVVSATIPDTNNIDIEYSMVYGGATTGGFTYGCTYVWYGDVIGWIPYEYSDTYNVAYELWLPCNIIYKRYLSKNKLPDHLSKLDFIIDKSTMQSDTSRSPITYRKYISAARSVIAYARKITTWTINQKTIIKYELPITADTVVYDLLTPVYVKDTIFTLDVYKLGFITKVETDVTEGKILLEVTLKP